MPSPSGGTKVQNETVTVPEVAEFLRVSRQTIYMMVKNGKIPHFRVGSKVRFKRSDIEALAIPTVKLETKPVTNGVEDE
jgi:excisionase family DNA binding protein